MKNKAQNNERRPKIEDLADIVRRLIREKDLTYQAVAERSRSRLKKGTIAKIVNRKQSDVGVFTLIHLARGLRVRPGVLLNAAERTMQRAEAGSQR